MNEQAKQSANRVADLLAQPQVCAKLCSQLCCKTFLASQTALTSTRMRPRVRVEASTKISGQKWSQIDDDDERSSKVYSTFSLPNLKFIIRRAAFHSASDQLSCVAGQFASKQQTAKQLKRCRDGKMERGGKQRLCELFKQSLRSSGSQMDKEASRMQTLRGSMS